MAFQTVCISFTLESGGEEIGHAVAEQLGFRYVDEEIITRAAHLAQVEPEVVAASEEKQSLLQRLLELLSSAQVVIDPESLAAGHPVDSFQPPAFVPISSDDLRILIRAAIHEVGRIGNAVIVAHAASMALAGKPGVLRVLITAPDETRIQRLAQAKMIMPADAGFAISESDSGRSSYFRTFYKIPVELPTHYDLVLNTEVLSQQQAATLIVAAARS